MRPIPIEPPLALPTCCANGNCAIHSAYLKRDAHKSADQTMRTSIQRSLSSSSEPRFRSFSKSKSFAQTEPENKAERPRLSKSFTSEFGKSSHASESGDRPRSGVKSSKVSIEEDKSDEEENKEEQEEAFVTDNVYKRFVLRNKGNVRLKHLEAILTEAGVPFDITKIDESDIRLRGEFILSIEEFRRLLALVRLDIVIEDDLEARLYKVPGWLVDEFSPQEIAMFKHHFMIIDIDKGGSIDASELQDLTESLGNRVSVEEVLYRQLNIVMMILWTEMSIISCFHIYFRRNC
jgi:hypothetical protein